MIESFQQFQYCLQLPSSHSSSNQHKVCSILITPQTDIEYAVSNLCKQNSIDINYSQLLVQSIKQQINTQIQHNKTKKAKGKLKKFKDRFCQYLTQACLQQVIQQKQSQKPEYKKSPSYSIEQYSFRPTYLKILQMADRQYSSDLKSFSRSISLSRNVFDELYQNSKILEQRKQLRRKQSSQQLKFQPQLNEMSRRIIKFKQMNPQQDGLNKTDKTVKTDKSKIGMIPLMLGESIYERGSKYLQRSRQKLARIKKQQLAKEMKRCTFQPVVNGKVRG